MRAPTLEYIEAFEQQERESAMSSPAEVLEANSSIEELIFSGASLSMLLEKLDDVRAVKAYV